MSAPQPTQRKRRGHSTPVLHPQLQAAEKLGEIRSMRTEVEEELERLGGPVSQSEASRRPKRSSRSGGSGGKGSSSMGPTARRVLEVLREEDQARLAQQKELEARESATRRKLMALKAQLLEGTAPSASTAPPSTSAAPARPLQQNFFGHSSGEARGSPSLPPRETQPSVVARTRSAAAEPAQTGRAQRVPVVVARQDSSASDSSDSSGSESDSDEADVVGEWPGTDGVLLGRGQPCVSPWRVEVRLVAMDAGGGGEGGLRGLSFLFKRVGAAKLRQPA